MFPSFGGKPVGNTDKILVLQPVTPPLGKLRQEGCCKLEISPGYIVSSRLEWNSVLKQNEAQMRTLEIFTKSSWGNKISSEYLKEIHLQKRYWTGPPELCRLHSLGGNWTCRCFGDYKLGLRCLWGHTVFVSLDCLKLHKHFQSLKKQQAAALESNIFSP